MRGKMREEGVKSEKWKVFLRTGETDCHSQFENWPRNDRGFYMGRGGRMNVGRGMKKERTVLSAPTGC